MGFLGSSLTTGERRLLFKNAHPVYQDTVGRMEMWAEHGFPRRDWS